MPGEPGTRLGSVAPGRLAGDWGCRGRWMDLPSTAASPSHEVLAERNMLARREKERLAFSNMIHLGRRFLSLDARRGAVAGDARRSRVTQSLLATWPHPHNSGAASRTTESRVGQPEGPSRQGPSAVLWLRRPANPMNIRGKLRPRKRGWPIAGGWKRGAAAGATGRRSNSGQDTPPWIRKETSSWQTPGSFCPACGRH